MTAAQVTTQPVLDLRGLVAGYRGVPVVHGIDLTVGAGEVVALLGSNGAGKTTTLLAVSGLLPPLEGTIEVLGERVPSGRRARLSTVSRRARSGVAHVPEDRGLFFDLTVRENLRVCTAPRHPTSAGNTRADVLDLFPALGSMLDRRAGLLSGGEQQMLALARALISQPRLLLVDEMSLGLAPIIVEQLIPILRTVADETGAGVLVVEQHVPLVLSVADRAYMLTRGHITAAGRANELAARRDLIESAYLGDVRP
jgi:branched-chain amino acid transport system ATP-binding protein